jgi:superfamily I DNA and RNA helicase
MANWLQPVNRFSNEQKEIYDNIIERLNNDEEYVAIIKGPAGTGKTLILAQIAREITDQNSIFFIYTNALRNFLNNAIKKAETGESTMETSVETFYKWLFSVYKHNVGTRFPAGEFSEKTDEMIEKLLGNVNENIIDIILVDEGQDFNLNVIKLLKKVSKKIVFVGDANQSIYESSDDLSDLSKILNPKDQFQLSISIRISPSILKFMRKYVQMIYDDLKTAKREEERDSKPLIYQTMELNDFLNYFIPNVAVEYLRANKNLVITCRHNEDVAYVYEIIRGINNSIKIHKVKKDRDQEMDFTDNAIFCTTMHSCKGLEFDNLLHLNINNEAYDGVKIEENLAYTVYTRPKEDLIIYSPDETIPLQKYLDFSYATVIDELDDDGEEMEIEELI